MKAESSFLLIMCALNFRCVAMAYVLMLREPTGQQIVLPSVEDML